MYEELGVDPHKDSVREIFDKITDNDYPGAFCKIINDPWTPGWIFAQHADGSGSKSVQRVLHHLETGHSDIYQDDVLDALGMNTGDLAAAGFVDQPYILTDQIAINALEVDKELILKELAIGFVKAMDLYKRYGFDIRFVGGETADLPDQCRSYILDMNVSTRAPREKIILGDVDNGDKIWGFASNGRAVWEDKPNSGIMSNGLTMARKVLMDYQYASKHQHLCHQQRSYKGKFKVSDKLSFMCEGSWMPSISDLLLSPTRQWAIVIKILLNKLDKIGKRHLIHGISMNTGGGATKVRVLGKDIIYEKEMPDPPAIFKLIQDESEEKWKNMYTSFNMGIGLDIIGAGGDGILAQAIRETAIETNINSYELGSCRRFYSKKNLVFLSTPYGKFSY